jgi:hypothetical protein
MKVKIQIGNENVIEYPENGDTHLSLLAIAESCKWNPGLPRHARSLARDIQELIERTWTGDTK